MEAKILTEAYWIHQDWKKSHEAREWLTSNAFRTTKEVRTLVEMLYTSGALDVRIGRLFEEPDRLRIIGGAYAEALFVVVSDDDSPVCHEVRRIAQRMRPDSYDWYRDEHHRLLAHLWWD